MCFEFKNKLLEEKSFLIIKSIDSSDDEDDDDESENLSTNKYELHIGDVIKLGRVLLKIRNFCINGQKVINKFINIKIYYKELIQISLIIITIIIMK